MAQFLEIFRRRLKIVGLRAVGNQGDDVDLILADGLGKFFHRVERGDDFQFAVGLDGAVGLGAAARKEHGCCYHCDTCCKP
ncbi:Uncharacterised protein [uncultured Ruminococcus sp.]|nr:Uncharacterised protein [uncultured Ruminococcus sp.]